MTNDSGSQLVMAILEAQEAEVEFFTGHPTLQPGMEGFWNVLGARAIDIRPGDMLMVGWREDDGSHGHDQYIVGELVPWGGTMDTIRVRFRDQISGELRSVGMLQPMQLVRWGTHRTLADSI